MYKNESVLIYKLKGGNVTDKRGKRIIYLLMNQENYVSAEKLAKKLDVSLKTVYRTINAINKNYRNGPLILSERGQGYKLDYSKYISTDEGKKPNSINDELPIQRRNQIMKVLLKEAPAKVRIKTLFDKYYISDSSKISDEKFIKHVLNKYNLEVHRSNEYLSVSGAEFNIRQAIKDLTDDRDVIDLKQILKNDNFTRKYDVRFVFKQIDLIESRIKSTIPYPYNVNLFTHMYILVDRTRNQGKRQVVESSKEISEYFRKIEPTNLLKIVSEEVIQNIEHYVHKKLSRNEAYYLYEYLISSRLPGVAQNIRNDGRTINFTNYLIETVENISGKKFTDSSFHNRLMEHVRPMLNRLENGIKINNSLLVQIRIEYGEMFNYIKQATQLITDRLKVPQIDENEIGFLTLYFAMALEEESPQIPTLIMCATGVGTSELLRVKVEKKFPDLKIVETISSFNLAMALKKHPETRLIISTIRSSAQVDIPVVVVSAMLTKEDEDNVKKAVRNIQWKV